MITRVRAAWSRLPVAQRVVIAAIVLITAQLAFRGWAVAGSWFYSDDFLFLGRYGIGEADADWFFTPHNIHIMPLSLWLSTWVAQAGAFAWWAAALQILAMQTAASLAFWWLLRTIFGDRPGILPPLALYLFLPASLGSVVWWAAALNQLPHQIALFCFLAFHVRYLRTHSRLALTGASLFFVLGLGVYTKALLFLPFAALLTIGFFVEGRWWMRPFRALGRWWAAWSVYAVIALLYVGYYVNATPSAPAPSWTAVLDTLQLTIVRTIGPALLGGPWQWQSLAVTGGEGPRLFAGTPWGFVALSWALLGAFVLWSVLHRRRGGWAPFLLLAYALGSALLVAFGRAGAFGTDVAALELRYHADLPAIAALVVALAWLPAIGSPEPVGPRPGIDIAAAPRRRWIALISAVVIAGIGWSSVRFVQPWHAADQMPQRAWIDTATGELSGRPLEIVDTGVPDLVIWSAAFPGNLASRVLSPLQDRVRPVESGFDLKMLGATGALAPAHVSGLPRSRPGPIDDCGYKVQGEALTIPVDEVMPFDFWLTVNFVAQSKIGVTVTAGGNSRDVTFPAGAHTFLMRTFGAFDSVTLTPYGDAAICVDGINVGPITPLEFP